jgi:phage shock protein PspC (stress-responsive transcriptional regulator)
MGASQVKRLYRSRAERMLGGVCGGLGEYFNTDPTLIRLLWTVLTFLSLGTGIVAYVIAWAIIPEKPADVSRPSVKGQPAPPPPANKLSAVVGAAFMVLGAIFLLHTLGILRWEFWFIWRTVWRLWPLLLILIGAALVLRGLQRG